MRCSSWTHSAVIAGLLLGAGRLFPQAPQDRAALAALRDTLAAISTPDALEPFAAPAGQGPLAKLREGFLMLRRGELAHSRTDLEISAARFDDATRAAPEWPWPWFGRGLAKLALGELGAVPKATAGQRTGEDYYTAFTRDAAEAFRRDSTFAPLVDLLARILVAQGDREQPAVFVHALEAAGRSGGADARVHLVVGRAYRAAGDYPRALGAFDALLAAAADSGIAQLERARTLAALQRLEDARTAYLAGARAAGQAARAVFRDDLAWIATPAELASFDASATRDLGGWLGRFWAMREAAEARSPGERLQEHLRRWAHVYAHFRVVHPERRTQFEKVRVIDIGPCSDGREKSLDDYTFLRPARLDDHRRRERVLDDRAAIYMRHGEPWQRRRPPGSPGAAEASGSSDESASAALPSISSELDAERKTDITGSEAWLYWFDGAARVFYFAGSDAIGRGRPTTLYAIPPLDANLFFLLADLDPAFARVAGRLQTRQFIASRSTPVARCETSVQDLIARSRADIQAAVTHDSYTLLFRKPLTAVVQTFAVGQAAADAGRILVTFAADAGALGPHPRTDGAPGTAYRLTIRIGAIDSATGVVRTIDTTRTFVRPDSLRAGQYLVGVTELPAPAGRYAVRVALFEPGTDAGMSVQRSLTTIDAGTPALSDVIVGPETGGLRWENDGDAVFINALGAYPEGSSVQTYYELSGLVPGHTYRTTIALRKWDKGKASRDAGVSLVFTDVADASTRRVRRSVSLAQLRRGQYQMTVTVADAAGGPGASRDQLVNVVAK